MEKIRIGVLGLGNISHRVIEGIQYSKNATLHAVCSRSIEKANQFKERYHCVASYDSYMDMLKDENIDMIYICTPNYLHHQHIMTALKMKKNVMCEKPMCLNLDSLSECFELAHKQNCFLMEAHKTAFTPLNQKLHQMIENGDIGNAISIEAQYATKLNHTISSWHFDHEGAGCMFDIGVYPICLSNLMANSPIKKVCRIKDQALIEYENGCVSHIATSWDCSMENTAHIYGENGTITYNNFWKTTKALINDKEICVDQDSDFTGEIEHACECIKKGLIESPILSWFASAQILKVIMA